MTATKSPMHDLQRALEDCTVGVVIALILERRAASLNQEVKDVARRSRRPA